MQPNSLQSPLINRLSDPTKVVDEPYNVFDIDLDDNTLVNSCVKELPLDADYWNQKPWKLKQTDDENINYYIGEQLDDNKFMEHQTKYIDNRLFTATRAIIAYAFGQLGKPELTPSKGDDKSIRVAKQLEVAVYQHAVDHKVVREFRTAGKNLIVRKRGYLKLRFDENRGPYGDIITESIDPSDIVVDRFARMNDNPQRLFHRQRCTIEELIAKFPDKEQIILDFYRIKQGRYSQMSRIVTYFECWFTFYKDNQPQEGVCWFIPNSQIILDKMRNPNWIYKGSLKKQKITNLTDVPIKPFVTLNYLNTGRSYIDETSLFDQAKPQQDILNKRGRQIMENADYAIPRLLIDKRVMEQSDADKFVNKHPKTIGLVDTTDTANDIGKAVLKIDAQMLPTYVVEEKYDARNEIDAMMGTPQQFRGQDGGSGGKNPTLGQDLLIKNQAGALQDDLVEVVNEAYAIYYMYLIQMMKVYLDDDYWVMTKGTSGQYVPIMMNTDSIDTNVKVGIQTDSTLPLDKESQRNTALMLAKLGRIDDLSLFEMLGLPDADKLAERVQRYTIDRYTYMQSIEQKLFNAEADADLTLLIANKVPEERADYGEDYLNHFNQFLTTNGFRMLPMDVQARITDFLHMVANNAATSQGMQDSMLNPAGIIDRPPIFPLPKREIRYNINSQTMSPQDVNEFAQEGTTAIPVTQQQPQPQAAPQPGGQPQQANAPMAPPTGGFGK